MSNKPHILIADDEPTNVKLLEALLLPQGYEVTAAHDGKEALRMASDDGIDLLLLDVMMPGLDGFEVTKRLRSAEKTRLLPIVLITALKEMEDRVKGIEAGCDDFISKPFDKNELLARVKTLLRLNYYRSLLDEKEKFEYVLNHMEDGIVVCDPNLKMTRWNQRAEDLLGIGSAVNGVDFMSQVQKGFKVHQVRYEDNLAKVKDQTLAFDLERPETEVTRPLILEVRSSVVHNPLGDISSIVMILHDVTEERRREFQEHSFLDLISHKLRTPISVIDGHAAMLKDGILGALNAEQKKSLDIIVDRTRDLVDSFEKLLGFTAIQSQNLEVSREPIPLKNFLPPLLGVIAKRIQDKKLEILLDCPDPSVILPISSLHLTLMVKNLVENAAKFNDHAVVKITVGVRRQNGQVEISFRDNGQGIPPEERGRVFEKFYQLDKHRTGNVKGTGLGLTIVRQLVSLYDGEVRLESEVGKGSAFCLSFPLKA